LAQSQASPSTTTTTAPETSPALQPEAPSPPAASEPANYAIPLPQIAGRAEELDRWLRDITGHLTLEADLLKSEQQAKADSEELHSRAAEVYELMAGTPTTLELQDEQRFWLTLSRKYTGQRELLTSRAAELEKQIRFLDQQQLDWQATWDEIYQKKEIEAVLERTRQELDSLRSARAELEKELNLILTVQNQVSQMDREISNVLASVREAQDRSRSHLFEQDNRPLWKAHELQNLHESVKTNIQRSFDRSFKTAQVFLYAQKFGIAIIVASFFLALLGALSIQRWLKRRAGTDVPEAALKVFAAPVSIALLVALVGTVVYVGSAPSSVALIFYMLYLIPVLRLLSPLLQPQLRKLLQALSVFYALEVLYLLVRIPPLLGRDFHCLIVLSALICFTWLARPSRYRELSTAGRTLRILKIGIWLSLLLLALSLAANIFGYVSLAQILGLTALLGAFAAVGLYCVARILMVVLSTLLRTDSVRSAIEVNVEQIERWVSRALVLGCFFLWLDVVLRLFTIYDYVRGAISNALSYPIGFQRVHITLKEVLSFFLILLVGYAFAKAVTFVLRKWLSSRFPLQRGLPFAISKVTYYILLVLVFLAALTNAGTQLNKFTLVTGALGVGVGFGLQNIVNNFASGLILLFERPIRVGDTIETKGLVGRVRRIGARSSTIHTFEDAEVIVPNSNLVSNEVINWTLSSLRRRVDLPLGVAYGTDPERILSLLVDLVASHPGVVHNPKPEAFFLGFGDSALNFELRFWTYQEEWFRLKSDVAVRLVKALREANIEVPFPQRDLHIRGLRYPIEGSYVQQ
jgi:small-conductance mechanosensitive channel